MSASRAPTLPARVRVSRLPLPPAPAVETRLRALFAAQLVNHHLADLSAGAVAVAGGKIIGAALRWPAGSLAFPQGSGPQEQALEAAELESGWRGRGIEEALRALLEAEPAHLQTAQR
ncbi:hypothetical protein [Deinococcus alpinitundrae]|uniref:hypothetical protein n=1 Tax=Deinococcus alpinitundrae TaxID=468913 RepID=UPI0013797B24|nr:hypothetical protein [Deinococcus alpinitundrae]